MLYRFFCLARRILRRKIWLILAPALALAYPVGWYLLVSASTSDLLPAEFQQALAAAAAKTVAPIYFYCKLGIAAAVFCFMQLLAYLSFNVVPVVLDWAMGRYARKEHYEAVGLDAPVLGFKRTFLAQSGLWRILIQLLVWVILLSSAGGSLYVAFIIQ